MGNLHSLFRSQLSFENQIAMYDYWQSKCGTGSLPSRSDLSPAEFVKFLPQISLIDVLPTQTGAARKYRYRLTGTGLRPSFSTEVTGKEIVEVFGVKTAAYWNGVLGVIAERKQPSCGALRERELGHNHFAQFWMRLPLVDRQGDVNMILGYDIFMPVSSLSADNLSRLAYA